VSWPDVRDYTRTLRSAYPALGNGQPAALFSSYDQQTVDAQFSWMREYGIDTAALQRFNPNGGEGATRDAMAVKVLDAAERYGRKFYVMYDATGSRSPSRRLRCGICACRSQPTRPGPPHSCQG